MQLTLLRNILEDSQSKRLYLHVSSLTFATLFALIPILAIFFLLLNVMGILNTANFQAFVVDHLFDIKGSPHDIDYLKMYIINLQKMPPSMIVFWFSSCTLLFYTIEITVSELYDSVIQRPLWRSLILNTLLMLTIPFALLFTFIINQSIIGWFNNHICTIASTRSIFCDLNILIPLSLDMLLCFIIFGVIPNKRPSFKAIMYASLVTTVLISIFKSIIIWYFNQTNFYGQIYGAMSTIPVFIIWVYIMWYLFLFGALLCHHIDQANKKP